MFLNQYSVYSCHSHLSTSMMRLLISLCLIIILQFQLFQSASFRKHGRPSIHGPPDGPLDDDARGTSVVVKTKVKHREDSEENLSLDDADHPGRMNDHNMMFKHPKMMPPYYYGGMNMK